MMTSGEKIVYMCLAGIRGAAWVRAVRPDGTVDLGADVGSKRLHELTGIEAVPPDQLRPGTCCEDVDAEGPPKAERPGRLAGCKG